MFTICNHLTNIDLIIFIQSIPIIQGSKVQATIIEDDIEKLEDTLQFYNTYLISNAIVKYVLPKYRLNNFEWQWTINANTLIQTVDESLSHDYLLNLDFVPFEQFEQHSGGQTTIGNSCFTLRISLLIT